MRPATTRLLLALQAAVFVVITPLAWAAPVDPLWIPGIYDDADQDDAIGILVDDGLAGQPPGRVADGPVPAAQRIGTPRGTLTRDNHCFSTLRLRSPPNS